MSVVTFIPYIQEYLKNEYIISSFIGEALSALIPSSITFIQIQSIHKNQETSCQNETTGNLVPSKPDLNFSIQFYFILIFLFMLASGISFFLLNLNLNHTKDTSKEVEKVQIKIDNLLLENENFVNSHYVIADGNKSTNETIQKIILLSIAFIICFFMFGLLLGLQSYSTLSYSHTAFHMSINLGNLFLPIAIFLSIWSYDVSLARILVEFSIAILCSVYIIVASVQSPCPPFVKHWFGSWLIVTSWILGECIFIRLKCIVSSKLEKYKDERLLLILGAVSLCGQMAGGILVYILVDVYRLFKHRPHMDECVFDFSYCE
jgi:hypothetical protein